jgi:hypothetical protein
MAANDFYLSIMQKNKDFSIRFFDF